MRKYIVLRCVVAGATNPLSPAAGCTACLCLKRDLYDLLLYHPANCVPKRFSNSAPCRKQHGTSCRLPAPRHDHNYVQETNPADLFHSYVPPEERGLQYSGLLCPVLESIYDILSPFEFPLGDGWTEVL